MSTWSKSRKINYPSDVINAMEKQNLASEQRNGGCCANSELRKTPFLWQPFSQ